MSISLLMFDYFYFEQRTSQQYISHVTNRIPVYYLK